jgi:hypothetical protein
MNLWSARCAETRTPGAEGGPEKRTSRKAGTALRLDPYSRSPQRERRATTYSDPHALFIMSEAKRSFQGGGHRHVQTLISPQYQSVDPGLELRQDVGELFRLGHEG